MSLAQEAAAIGPVLDRVVAGTEALETDDGRRCYLRPISPGAAAAAGASCTDTVRAALAALDEQGVVVALAVIGAAPTSAAAEASVVVREDWRRVGVGTALLRRLVEKAADQHIQWLVATVAARDQAAAHLIAASGVMVARRVEKDVAKVALHVPSSAVI
jgi:GNAT superfamily N-acetyltransferase